MYKYEEKLKKAKKRGDEISEAEEVFLRVSKESGLKFLDRSARFYLMFADEAEDQEEKDSQMCKAEVAMELSKILDEILCRFVDEFTSEHAAHEYKGK